MVYVYYVVLRQPAVISKSLIYGIRIYTAIAVYHIIYYMEFEKLTRR